MPEREKVPGTFIEFSLVNVPVKAFPAVRSREVSHFHQIHADCGQRIRYAKQCPVHGPVDSAAIVKGYEFGRDQHVILDPDELDALRPAQDRALRLERFVEPGQCDPVCWGGYANLANYPPVLRAHQLYFSQAIVWVKEHPVLTRKDFMGNFELAFYGWREGAAHQFHGPNNVTDVWSVKKVNPQNMIHLTEKPVELAVRAIQYCSAPGENVLDLFGGSGSTLIAAEQTQRKAFLMELDALYCDVIVQRWERFTGKRAERRRGG